MKLYAPELYWALTPAGKKEFCNGCGAKGLGWMVPESIWGLDISEACNIHDFMYAMGIDEEDRESADRVFRNNMLRIVKTGSKWLLPFRVARVLFYYLMIQCVGGVAFWSGKNEPGTEKEVT